MHPTASSRAASGPAIPTGSSAFNGIRSACRKIRSRSACFGNSLPRRVPVRPSLTRSRLAVFFEFRFSSFNFGGFMISLAGKAALITGGSRGIGAAAVKLFAQARAHLVFNYATAKHAALQGQQEAGKHRPLLEAFKA